MHNDRTALHHYQKGDYTMPDEERKGQLGDDWTRVSLPIERELYQRARVAAAMRGQSAVAYIRDAIRAALDEQPTDERLAEICGRWGRLTEYSRATLQHAARAIEAVDDFTDEAGKGE